MVLRWLGDCGLDMYSDNFHQNDIDGNALLGLTNDDLRELGVSSLGHRKKLIDEITALEAQGSWKSDVGDMPTYVQSVYSNQPMQPLQPKPPRPSSGNVHLRIPQRSASGQYSARSRPSTARSARPQSARSRTQNRTGGFETSARITYDPDPYMLEGLTPREYAPSEEAPSRAVSRTSRPSTAASRVTYVPGNTTTRLNMSRPASARARTSARPPTAGSWRTEGTDGRVSMVVTPRPPSTRPGSAGTRDGARSKTPRVEEPGAAYQGRDVGLRDKGVLVYSGTPAYRDSVSKLVRHIGYRCSVAGSHSEAVTQMHALPGLRTLIVSCDPYMETPAHELVAWIRKQKEYKGVPVILFADPEEAGHDTGAMSSVLTEALSCGHCLSLTPPLEVASLKQILEVAMMMWEQNHGQAPSRKTFTPRPSSLPLKMPASKRPHSGASSRPMSARTPRCVLNTPGANYHGPGSGLVNKEEESEKEKKKLSAEVKEQCEKRGEFFAISGYVGHVPGVNNHTYGKVYQETIMRGPKSIVPTERVGAFPFVPDQRYPHGHQCEYAKEKKNMRNKGSIVMGDIRFWDDTTTYDEFYKSSAPDKPASQMLTWLEGLSKEQLKAQYSKAEKMVGRAVVDGWEQDMRDKITMYSSGGSFFIRRAFKYFDRDGSGSVDFDEFKFALDTFGMNLSDEQLLAFFGRYDIENLECEISYLTFINELLDEGSMYKETKKAVGAKISALFDEGEQKPKEELSEEEKIQQRPLIERMFNDLDLDGSGRLDLDEVRQLCTDLGLELTDEQYVVVMQKLDEDGSGEVDVDEFFEWYIHN